MPLLLFYAFRFRARVCCCRNGLYRAVRRTSGKFQCGLWINGVGVTIGALSAAAAALAYVLNVRTKRAEFLIGLHKSFFADATGAYGQMKSLLDSGDASQNAALETVVREEKAEFTDFLNFFELIAYLAEIKALERDDAEALLGYYFDLLRNKPSVWAYIAARRNGFERLRHLLHERSPM